MKWLRRHIGKIIVLFLLHVLTLGLVLLWQIPKWMEHRVLAAFAQGVGAPVTVGDQANSGINFEWPNAFVLMNITVGDSQNPALVVARARLQIDWSATLRDRAIQFTTIRLQTPVLKLPFAQAVVTAAPNLLSNRPTARMPWSEIVVEDGMMQWTADSLSVQIQGITLQAGNWAQGVPDTVVAKGNVSGRWREYEFSGDARLDAEWADGKWRLTCTVPAGRASTGAEPLTVGQLVVKWSSSDTRGVLLAAENFTIAPLTLTGVDGELYRTDTGFTGQVLAASSMLGRSELGMFQAQWLWQPGKKYALAPLRLGQEEGGWEGSWISSYTDSPAATRVLLTGRRVPLAPLLAQIMPNAEFSCRGNVDAVVRGTFTSWGAARAFEGEVAWAGDSLAVGFPAAWEAFMPLWRDDGATELAPCAMAATLKGTPRLTLLSTLQVRHPALLVVATGHATAAGNLQLEVTAVPQREGALRFSEHGGLDIPPGRTAQSRWQVAGTTENPRWDWLTPFPVDTVLDPEPYLLPPAALTAWDADWQRAIALPPMPAVAADTVTRRKVGQ